MSEAEHPFQPGVEVAIVSRGFGNSVSCRVKKVAKVHKSGRFVLDGSDQQYRASSYTWPWGVEWTGRATGGGYGRDDVQLVTERLLAEVAQYKLSNEFRNLVEKLSRLRMNEVTAEQVEAARRLVADLSPPKDAAP